VPMPVTTSDRKILGITGAVFLLMLVGAIWAGRGASSNADVPSVYSSSSNGAKAAYLLLQESGYPTDRWEQPISELGVGKDKLLILAEPEIYPEKEDRQPLETFLKSGGTVLAAGRFAAFYLPQNDAAIDPIGGSTWQMFPAVGLSPISRMAPEIALVPSGYWRADRGGVPLYGDALKPVVVEYKVGEGRVLWLASATPLTNAGLKEPGNLEFLLAAVGLRGQNQILWDEYIHGYQRAARSRTSHRVLGWVALQLGLCGVAVLLAYSRRNAPVWTPVAEVRLSPLEFVRTLGTLYDHANAGSVAVEIYYQRFRYLLTRKLGLPVNSSVEDLDRAVRRRWDLQDERFAETLRECESLRYDPNIRPQIALRLVQALFGYAQQMQLVVLPKTISSNKESKAWKPS
jgi:Domain of unknown function (DUF4350)